LEKHFVMTTHFLALHCGRLELFCFNCGDYIYDVEFDLIRRFTLRAFREGLEVEAADHVVSSAITYTHTHTISLSLSLSFIYFLG